MWRQIFCNLCDNGRRNIVVQFKFFYAAGDAAGD
jgi:hypothetical protein